jgi:hypothetical protein
MATKNDTAGGSKCGKACHVMPDATGEVWRGICSQPLETTHAAAFILLHKKLFVAHIIPSQHCNVKTVSNRSILLSNISQQLLSST